MMDQSGSNNPAYKHGHTNGGVFTPEYYSWACMIQRCTNPNTFGYKYYGARGVTISERWMVFTNFLEDMGRRPTVFHSLDRINNDKGYCKENCRWATKSQQCKNRRSARGFTIKSKVLEFISTGVNTSTDIQKKLLEFGAKTHIENIRCAIRELRKERLIDVKKVQIGRAKINVLTTAVTSCPHNGANQ